MPSQRSWCCDAANTQSPSQPSSGASISADAAGWPWSSAHSLSLGLPGLLRMSGETVSLPMSWSMAPQVSSSRSASETPISSAISRACARTRSVWPLVSRSWLLSRPINSTAVAAAELASSPNPSLFTSSYRLLSRLIVFERRATLNRDGAWSGKTRVMLSSEASGISLRVNSSAAIETESPVTRACSSQITKPIVPAGRRKRSERPATAIQARRNGVAVTRTRSATAVAGEAFHWRALLSAAPLVGPVVTSRVSTFGPRSLNHVVWGRYVALW